MQMYVPSMDELNKVDVRGRNGQVPSESQMCDAGKRGPRNDERKHKGYLENGTLKIQCKVCKWRDSMRKYKTEV